MACAECSTVWWKEQPQRKRDDKPAWAEQTEFRWRNPLVMTGTRQSNAAKTFTWDLASSNFLSTVQRSGPHSGKGGWPCERSQSSFFCWNVERSSSPLFASLRVCFFCLFLKFLLLLFFAVRYISFSSFIHKSILWILCLPTIPTVTNPELVPTTRMFLMTDLDATEGV